MLDDIAVTDFWEDSDYARESYVDEDVTPELVRSVEQELGFRLPLTYIELMRSQNGGIPQLTCFPTKTRTSWAEDHIAISGFLGIGRKKNYSLLGSLGSRFKQTEWGYPDFGICICNCPSAGHDMVMLDYRACGPHGEPAVVHVDQESDFKVTFLAPDFESFVRGLVHESKYDTSAADLEADLTAIRNGSFSTPLTQLIARSPTPEETEKALRLLLRSLTVKKGRFSLHGDEDSHLVYDVLFDLLAGSQVVRTPKAFVDAYESLIAFGDGEVTIGGYAPGYLDNWVGVRLASGQIKKRNGQLMLSESHQASVRAKLSAFLG